MSRNEHDPGSLSLEAQIRIARCLQKFETALRSGQRPQVAEQLTDWRGDERAVLLQQLLAAEVDFTTDQGQPVSREEYQSRYPDSVAIVNRVFDEQTSRTLRRSFQSQSTMPPGPGDTLPEMPQIKPASVTADAGALPQPSPDVSQSSIEPPTLVDPRLARLDSAAASKPQPEAITEAQTLNEVDLPTDADQEAALQTLDQQTLNERAIADPLATLPEGSLNRDEAATLDEHDTPVLPTKHSAAVSRRVNLIAGGRLGDYELLSELGRGGMGVVYKARQRRANRIVALKVIRPDRLGGMTQSTQSRIIDRFRKEAQIAARLQHDHLVTVFEVGELDGCHYFSMQYVEGRSLADKLRTGPLDNRQAAAILEPVCRAVGAAHRAGILHRDIKPQNILIEDETNRPRIADFGLAKFLDGELELTSEGETMGTPPYMPPEQFGAAATCTEKADIYALGATLYHSLSGRPPFQAASSIATMRQVLDQEPVSLRQLNAAVDADLETIAMKCLEKEPARRFGSSEQLADELKRYLNGEPILARPISRRERAWRWSRRNPVIASLIGGVIASILFGVTSLAVAFVKTETARVAVEKSLDETKAARAMSEASFQDALSAVNEFFTKVSEERLLNEPGAQSLRRELLDLARTYYQRFLTQRADDPTVVEELAATHYRMGLILEELDSPAASLASYEKAREMLDAQSLQNPGDKSVQKFLSNTLNAMGRAVSRTGNLDRAEELIREARQIRAALVATTPDPLERFEYDRLLANTDMNLALLDRQRGQFAEARDLMRKAQAFRYETLPVKPQDSKLRRDLAKGHYNLANLAVDLNEPATVETDIRKAIDLFQNLLTENPDDIEDRHMLALCWRILADLNAALIPQQPTALDVAIENYAQARTAFETLVARNPAVPRYRGELAQLLINLAQLEAQRQRTAEATALFREAELILKQLVDESPDVREYSSQLDAVRAAIRQLEALSSKTPQS